MLCFDRLFLPQSVVLLVWFRTAFEGHSGPVEKVRPLQTLASAYRANVSVCTPTRFATIPLSPHIAQLPNDLLVTFDRYDPERLSICAAAANDDLPALDGLLAQGVHVDSRHRIRTYRGWHHERYTPLISACSQVSPSDMAVFAVHNISAVLPCRCTQSNIVVI